MMNVPRMSCFPWCRKTVARGSLRMRPESAARVKVSDSTSRSRTQRPMTTITAENRKGTRHPQLRNASDFSAGFVSWGSSALIARKTPFAMMNPSGAPSCGNDPYHARFPAGAFSVATSAAPDHSPPSAKPWVRRRIRRSRAAHQLIA